MMASTGENSKLSQSCTATSADPLDVSQLYSDYGADVYRALRYFGLHGATLEDAAQDVFLVAHQRLHTLSSDASPRSWLFGIARRIAHWYRRKDTRPLRHGWKMPPPPVPQGIDPEEQSQKREAAQFVEKFLAKLDEVPRQIFMLSDIEGLRGPEIAEIMQMNINTVYTKLRRTRAAFERVARREGW